MSDTKYDKTIIWFKNRKWLVLISILLIGYFAISKVLKVTADNIEIIENIKKNTDDQVPPKHEFSGKIVDDNLNPIYEANIEIIEYQEYKTSSNNDGTYNIILFENLPDTINIFISHPDYKNENLVTDFEKEYKFQKLIKLRQKNKITSKTPKKKPHETPQKTPHKVENSVIINGGKVENVISGNENVEINNYEK